MDTNEHSAEIREKYNAALQNIEGLERQLSQQTHDFDLLCNAHSILSDGMKCCFASLAEVQEKLQAMAAQVNQTNNSVFKLMLVNRALKTSADEWFRRAIKLEFNVLTLKNELKKSEHQRDLAIKKFEYLYSCLISTNNQTHKGRTL